MDDDFDIEVDASTTAYETREDRTPTYSERTEEFEPEAIRGDSSDEVDPRRLMDDPNIDSIRYLYRTMWAKTIVDKPVDDAFKNGYEVVSPGDGRDPKSIIDEFNYEFHYKQAQKKARRDGFALNFLVLDDDAESPADDPFSDDVAVEGLHKIETLTLDDLARYEPSGGVINAGDPTDPLDRFGYENYEIRPTGIVLDIDPTSRTYKEPLGYLVGPDNFAKNFDTVDFVHRNRILHHTVSPEVDGDVEQATIGRYEGDSVLVPTYHILRGLKKGNWSLMQTVFRYASKMYHVELPEDADEDDFDAATNEMQDLNSKSEIITPTGYEVQDFQTDGQLEPAEYFDVLFKQVCAATEMTKSVLFGTQSGTVSGSETDIKNYFNKVERLRQQQYADDIRRFVSRYVNLTDGRARGDYRAEFEIDWAPMFRLTELDQAETLTRKMQTLSSAINNFVLTPSEARSIMQEEWSSFEMNVEDDVLTDEEREFIESINVAEMGAEAALTNQNEQQGVQQGSPEQRNGGGREQGQTSDPSDPTSDEMIDAIVEQVAERINDGDGEL